MSKVQSVWSKADKFLTLSRKIIINLFTVVVLIVITFSLIGGIGSFFSEEDSISTKDKVLWFKPVGVVVDSSSSSSTSLDDLILGSTDIQQHELEDLIKVLENAADDKNLAAIYINVSELGMYYASAFEIANAVKNIKDKGKRVIAYGQNFGNNAFLISSQANEIILNKYGRLFFHVFPSEFVFFSSALKCRTPFDGFHDTYLQKSLSQSASSSSWSPSSSLLSLPPSASSPSRSSPSSPSSPPPLPTWLP